MNFYIDKPTLIDIPQMRNLIMPEVQKGIILDRTEDEMATSIRSYSVVRIAESSLDSAFPTQESQKNAEFAGKIVAFAALQILSLTLAEVRSLIVAPNFRRKGLATLLITHLLKEARELNIKEVLSLTYQREVFEKLGFKEIAKESLPNQKIWADCIKCTKFPVCDEIAMLKTL